MGSIEGNSTLTACQCRSKLKVVAWPVLPKKPFDGHVADAERLSEEWPSEWGSIRKLFGFIYILDKFSIDISHTVKYIFLI